MLNYFTYLRLRRSGVAEDAFNFARHYAQYHGGHFDPATQSCKYYDEIAEEDAKGKGDSVASNSGLAQKRFEVVPLTSAPFNDQKSGIEWAERNGIVRMMEEGETGGKGRVRISRASVDKMLHGSAIGKSASRQVHFAALMRLPEIIRASLVCEEHPDFKKVNGKRSPENGINPNVSIAVLYGAVSFGGRTYRVKTTLKKHRDNDEPTKAYSYEISNIEVLPGTAEPVALPNGKTSIAANILLKGVRDCKGNLLLPESSSSPQGDEP